MNIGIVTGREVGKFKDGDKDRMLLQVKIFEDDTRQVELISQHGEDVNPGDACRVIIFDITETYQAAIAITDDLAPEVDAGEKEIYSTNSPVTTKLARIKLDKNGNVINNQGSKSVVTYASLDAALQQLITDINTALSTKLDGGGSAGTLALDISGAESPTIKVP